MDEKESEDLKIIDYRDEHKNAFKELNEKWISKYFSMEEPDYKILDHPQENILDKGGYILIALYKGETVGTCALLNAGNGIFELVKMAVSAEMTGKGIGLALGAEAIKKAKKAGAKKLCLESSTTLKPAINLYHKLGFKDVSGIDSAYKRCNTYMEMNFEQA
jgi:N-acetylglutamate synthase-like GNAT family acetyltransferase